MLFKFGQLERHFGTKTTMFSQPSTDNILKAALTDWKKVVKVDSFFMFICDVMLQSFICSNFCLSIRPFVRSSVRLPQALSGLKSALSGLKSGLSSLRSALSSLDSA